MPTINQRSPIFGVNVRVFEEGPLKILNAALYHMNAVAADIDLVPSASYTIERPWSLDPTDIIRIKRISLILSIIAKNTFAGDNALDGAQDIQVNLNGGGWGSICTLPTLSIPCGQNGTHGLTIVASIDGALPLTFTDLGSDTIGVRWALAKALNDGYDLTVSAYAKILWEV